MSAKSEVYLLKQENRVKNPKRQNISLTVLVGAEALRGGWLGVCDVRRDAGEGLRGQPGSAEHRARSQPLLPHLQPRMRASSSSLSSQPILLAWPKPVTLCQSPCARQLRKAALLRQLQLKIQSETGRLLPGASLATKLSRLLRAADYEQAASFPALSSHPCLPLASQSHYRTQLLLHVESW